MEDREQLIACLYFRLGLNHKEILYCLSQRHGIVVSLRHLKRFLRGLHLYRRKYKTDLLGVALFIEKELSKSGQLHGCRWLHRKCLLEGLVIDQETVRLLLLILGEGGVAIRRGRRLKRPRYTETKDQIHGGISMEMTSFPQMA